MFESQLVQIPQPQGHHPLLAWPPGIFSCAKAPGLGTREYAQGGMVTGQIDICIISVLFGDLQENIFKTTLWPKRRFLNPIPQNF